LRVSRLLSCKIILKKQVLYATQCWQLTLRVSRLLSYKIILKKQVVFISDAVLEANFEGQ
jgi:hypothetical protein